MLSVLFFSHRTLPFVLLQQLGLVWVDQSQQVTQNATYLPDGMEKNVTAFLFLAFFPLLFSQTMLAAVLCIPGPTFLPHSHLTLMPRQVSLLWAHQQSGHEPFWNPVGKKMSYLPLLRLCAGRGLLWWIVPVWKGLEFKKQKQTEHYFYENCLDFDFDSFFYFSSESLWLYSRG